MLLYNVTVIAEDSIAEEWLSWTNANFIPAAMSSGLFESNKLLKVLGSPNEGQTFCLQFVCSQLEEYNSFKATLEKSLFEQLHSRFGNKLVSFNSLMQYIDKEK